MTGGFGDALGTSKQVVQCSGWRFGCPVSKEEVFLPGIADYQLIDAYEVRGWDDLVVAGPVLLPSWVNPVASLR